MAAEIDPWKEQEWVQVARLLHAFEPGMPVLADAGFSSYEPWRAAAATGADLVWRVRSEVGDPQQKRHNREYERKRRADGMAVDYIQKS
ncbi:hypothetical protein [Amycolatopsis magusensis]|uniref:hypothetical protein n=1 Tax=Amycolatopsis magusensis TaxID=882444 RepID=UPI0037992E0D